MGDGVLDGLADNAPRVTPNGCPIALSLSKSSNAALLRVCEGGPGLSGQDCRIAFERTIAAGPAAEETAAFSVTIPLI